MFLEIPIMRYSRKKNQWENDVIDLNPFQVISVEKDPEDARCCIVVMVNGAEWYAKMTRQAFRKKVSAYMEENMMTKIYKQIKDQGN